jgi:diguanylate cyclase (GGDEF)-like protein
MMLDIAGVVVGGSTSLGERLRGTVLPPSMIGPAEQGVIEHFLFEDRAFVAAYAGLLSTGGTIVVMQARENIFALVEAEAVRSLSLLALLSVFVFALVWLGGEILVLRPMKVLATTAKALGSGDYSSRAVLSGFARELRTLGEAFNSMGAELEIQNRRLADQAMSDGLTGLRNKRAFNEQLEVEMKRARRERRTLCLILLDIDHFKKFNDRYGHAAGDDTIKGVAGVLAGRARRGGDIAARVGGEEFALVLPDCQLEHGREIAEDINRSVVALQIAHADSDYRVVSVSIGITTLNGQDTARSLVERADEALYRSKKAGRNRTETIASVYEAPAENAA